MLQPPVQGRAGRRTGQIAEEVAQNCRSGHLSGERDTRFGIPKSTRRPAFVQDRAGVARFGLEYFSSIVLK